MTLVERIRYLARDREDMSIPELEVRLGFGNGTISRWKTASPSIDKLQKIADFFNVSIDYLLERDDVQNSDIALDISKLLEKLERDDCLYQNTKISEADADLIKGHIELMLKRIKSDK